MATTLNVIITDAGIAEVLNAEHTGTAPVVLTQVGLGRGVYTPTPDQTALHDEIKRLSAISGGVVGDNIMHIQALDGAAGASYAVYEIGVYTASGTLFAVYSQALPIIHKVADSEIMLAIDFVLAGFEPTSVTVGDTNYSLAPATTSNQGVVELATDAEAIAGTDEERALTPKSGAAAMDDKIGTHSDLIADDGVPGHFSYKIGSSVSNSPFETFTEDGKTYHRLRTTYLTNILVTRSGGQEILGNKGFNGSVYFRSSATATSASTFTFEGNVAFAPSGASAAVTFDNTGFRIGTDANPVVIDSNGIAVGGYTFDVGSFDYPVNSIKAKSVYVEEGIYVNGIFRNEAPQTANWDIGESSKPFNAIYVTAVYPAYVGSNLRPVNEIHAVKVGNSATPVPDVYANNLHGVIDYPSRSTSSTILVPVGGIICVYGITKSAGETFTVTANNTKEGRLDGTAGDKYVTAGTYVALSTQGNAGSIGSILAMRIS